MHLATSRRREGLFDISRGELGAVRAVRGTHLGHKCPPRANEQTETAPFVSQAWPITSVEPASPCKVADQ